MKSCTADTALLLLCLLLTHSSPVKEVVYAVRAISPLLVALVLLVVVVLRQPLPSKGFTDFEDEDEEDSSSPRDQDDSAHGSKPGESPRNVAVPGKDPNLECDWTKISKDVECGNLQVSDLGWLQGLTKDQGLIAVCRTAGVVAVAARVALQQVGFCGCYSSIF